MGSVYVGIYSINTVENIPYTVNIGWSHEDLDSNACIGMDFAGGILTAFGMIGIGIALAISGCYWAFTNPMDIDETTPLHELGIGFAALVIMAVVGSFLGYHLYLISINRTTLEDLSPFLLLRLIPNLTNPHDPFPTPEHRLTYNQRRVLRRAHRQIQLYNVGRRKNWGQVFGWERRRGWVYRLLLGGAGKGDGRAFPRNPGSEEMLAKLVDDLHNADKDL